MLMPLLQQCPLVAILRGITPEEALPVTERLVQCGFAIVEVPLNSPDALESIRRMSAEFGREVLIGAGTVTAVQQVRDVAATGARLVVSPNCDSDVIFQTKQAGMVSLPGCCTPTEAFQALAAGADAIKLFPATMITPQTVRALRAVLPPVPLLAVGGIEIPDFAAYINAGIDGFGTGSGLYRPGMKLQQIESRARDMVTTIRALLSRDPVQITEH